MSSSNKSLKPTPNDLLRFYISHLIHNYSKDNKLNIYSDLLQIIFYFKKWSLVSLQELWWPYLHPQKQHNNRKTPPLSIISSTKKMQNRTMSKLLLKYKLKILVLSTPSMRPLPQSMMLLNRLYSFVKKMSKKATANKSWTQENSKFSHVIS
jgi:hypothetical protein